MRIYSKFRDYYDVGLKYGVDPNCVYQRTTQELDHYSKESKKISDIMRSKAGELPPYWDAVEDFILILFCGQLYCAAHFFESFQESSFIYTYDALVRYVKGRQSEPKFAKILDTVNHWYDKKSNIKDIFDKFPTERDPDLTQLLIDTGVPIIRCIVHRRSWKVNAVELNPRLKDYEFFKAVDPVTAFQELSMFISGVMGGTAPPMVTVSDTVRLEKHGFDKVKSFRNMK